MMKKYRVMLGGANFWLQVSEKLERVGLYTTRYVEADSAEEAAQMAMALVKEDTRLQMAVMNDYEDQPDLFAESVDEMESFDGVEVPGEGYTFFPEDEDQ